MAEKPNNPDRRDWTLIIFLLPFGILLMLVAGQIAIRLVPFWHVTAGMQSNLDPRGAKNSAAPIQPISIGILTPMSWLDNFLTPGPDSGAGASFAPFVVFEPSSTPAPAGSPTSTSSATSTSTATSVTSTSTSTSTAPTKKPKGGGGGTPVPTCSDPAANNVGSPLPCTYTPVSSTPVGIADVGTPVGFNVGAPNGGTVGNPADGHYFVADLSANPIVVNGPSDTNYDFVYYERYVNPCGPTPCTTPPGSGIQMDNVILSISADMSTYYVVFNWGDGTPDANSNLGAVASSSGTENDNQSIDSSQLYGSGTTQTGVLVDVDNAPSHPPVGSYPYLAIQAPITTPAPGDGADVDAIQVTEVPSPFP